MFELENDDPVQGAPCVLLMGKQGSSKTMQAARMAPHYTWVCSDKTGLGSWGRYVEGVEQGKIKSALPVVSREEFIAGTPGIVHPREFKRIKMYDEKEEDGSPKTNHYQFCLGLANLLHDPNIRGLVVDEGSALLHLMHRDIQATVTKGFKAFDIGKEAYTHLIKTAKALGKGLVLLHHWREPRYHEIEKDEEGKLVLDYIPTNIGERKHFGGPDAPGGNMMGPICASVDASWYLRGESKKQGSENVEYYVITDSSQNDLIKTRDGGLKQKNKWPLKIDWGIKELLEEKCGFVVWPRAKGE